MDTVSIKKLPDSEVEIQGEVPAAEFDSYRKRAIEELGKEVEIAGFRKGHVPEAVLVQKLGEGAILNEMAELAIANFYPKLILEKKIEAIGRPEIVITKMAAGNPLVFKAKTAVFPSIELPDYKKIAEGIMTKEDKNIAVEAKDVDETIETIRKNWAKKDAGDKGGDPKAEFPLPEFNDEFVGKLGDFKTVADFKKKLEENLLEEKKTNAREKKRIETMDAILEKAKMEIPKILVENEQRKMMMQFKDNIAMMGLDPQKYFAQVKKTEDEVKAEWVPEAAKRVKIQLALSKIAEAEKITVPEEDLSKEVSHLMEHYAGADPDRARAYAEEIMRNDMVWKYLEGNKN